MAGRVEGKIALVVGGGQTPGQTIGNGRATAIVLAREGAMVVVADRDLASAEETVRMIREQGGTASACHHSSGSHSVPSGCGAEACPTTVPSSGRQSITLVDCVDESTPATSIGGSLVEVTTHDNAARPRRRVQVAIRR